MSTYSTDSDLLPYAPNVFHDLPLAGQTKLRVGDASISGVTVTSATGGFAALAAGDVAVIGDGAFAIAAIVNNTTLTLAKAPVGVTGGTLVVRSFAPQAARVHGELLRSLGLDPDDPDVVGGTVRVTSLYIAKRLEALGTLAFAYGAGVTLAGATRAVKERAEHWRREFTQAMNGAAVLVDLDGDGEPDDVRYPGVGQMVRV